MAEPTVAQAPSRRRSLADFSIELKLPLLTCGLLLAVVALSSWAAYRGVRDSAFAAARERLVSVTDQLASLLRRQGGQLGAAITKAAANDTIRRFLQTPSSQARLDALAVMRRMGPASEQVVAVELWSPRRQRLLTTAGETSGYGSGGQAEYVQWAVNPDTGLVGRLQLVHDSLLYPVSAVVSGPQGPLGYVVQWRRGSSDKKSREGTLQLIGSGASLYIGNDRGDFWTDLITQASKPPINVRAATGILAYNRPEGPVFAAARGLAPLPWVVLVEFPERLVAAPVRLFLRRLMLIDLLIVAIGLGVAWFLGRRIAGPLRLLANASTAIAAGDFTTTVKVSRRDELGHLADAFTTMAGHIRDSQARLEEQVRVRTAELQERNDELEAFGYSISHDLRAPLRAMQGFSQALLEDCGDRLDATGREYAERIVAGSQRMDELIRDLLAYSRVSRAELRLVGVPLTPVAQNALAELSGAIRARQAVVRVDEPLPIVLGHPATLSQVLINLLGNGLKFVPPERTPELRIRSERRNGMVRVWVEDNGIGIAPEHQVRVFRVFERLHSTAEYPGTGIGLAIVRKGIERMGGQVGVESRLGSGSRFWVELQPATGAGA